GIDRHQLSPRARSDVATILNLRHRQRVAPADVVGMTVGIGGERRAIGAFYNGRCSTCYNCDRRSEGGTGGGLMSAINTPNCIGITPWDSSAVLQCKSVITSQCAISVFHSLIVALAI
ncbi:hypothetical protein PENTCL1PPCAC_20164, partial [Pristionchus entomophagus]